MAICLQDTICVNSFMYDNTIQDELLYVEGDF
jgi:hypothetical protein